MEWDALGMHDWLLNLSIQEEPPGSIPNDMAVIRRWLRSPSDDVWRRVQPQIFAAWKFRDSRWYNDGIVRACDRRDAYAKRSKVPNRYETGTRIPPDPMNTEEEVFEVDVGSKELSRIEVALIIQQQCHISGAHFSDVIEKQLLTFSLGNALKVAAERMMNSIIRFKELGGKKVYFFIAEGEWLNDESSWFGQTKKSGQQERQQRNRDGLTAALRNRYGADGGESSSETGEGTNDRGVGGLGRAAGAGTGTGD